MCSLTKNVFSYPRMCSLTLECVLLPLCTGDVNGGVPRTLTIECVLLPRMCSLTIKCVLLPTGDVNGGVPRTLIPPEPLGRCAVSSFFFFSVSVVFQIVPLFSA